MCTGETYQKFLHPNHGVITLSGFGSEFFLTGPKFDRILKINNIYFFIAGS